MIEPAAFHASLVRHGLTFFTGVPDSLLRELGAYVNDHVPPSDHVINANEGSAVALAAGYHLATGEIPVVYLQNSGTGNAVNPLLSLADPAVYGIPMLLLVGWRGEPGTKDEPQHMTQGRVQVPMLDAIGIPHEVVGAESSDFDAVIGRAVDAMRREPRPHALLVRAGTFAATGPTSAEAAKGTAELTRPRAIGLLLEALDSADLVVATTGMTSREVFDHRERHGQGHERDFLTVGSMGHASQVALGLALRRPDRTIVCLDGDGALIMHMGSLAIIGSQAPRNLRHVVINNGAHDSVGGQPTAARSIDLPAIATACGYVSAERISAEAEVAEAVGRLRGAAGPSFLEVRVASQPHTDAGRPTTTPAENKAAFMQALDDAG